jgi:hypothetical protein
MSLRRQLLIIASACILTSGHSLPQRALPLKGMRAIFFHGSSMPEMIRVTGLDEANAFYGSITGAFFSGTKYTRDKLQGRPCIAIDAIRAASAPHLPDSALSPYYADYRYWFYPAIDDQPAVFMTGHEVPNQVLQMFKDAGVIVQLARDGSKPCELDQAR